MKIIDLNVNPCTLDVRRNQGMEFTFTAPGDDLDSGTGKLRI